MKFLAPLFLLIILSLGLYLRFHDIELRPLHHDESVNHFFLEQTYDKGYYPYSHENYHGPTHFYLLALSHWLIGEDSILALRLPSILSSLCLLLPLLGLRSYLNIFGLLSAATLILLSSSFVFYARYSIHEVFFALQTFWLAVAVFGWKQSHKHHWLYQGAIALALLILTKETYVISGFCIFCGYLAIEIPRRDIPLLYQQRKTVACAFLILFFITLLVVSGGFQWMGGAREIFLSVPQWIGRNVSDTGHHKPFWYYRDLIWKTEPYLFFFPLVAVVVLLQQQIIHKRSFFGTLFSQDFRLQRFTSLWALTSFFVYSYLKYKMPWLALNITLPGILAMASWLGALSLPSFGYSILALLLATISSYETSTYVFRKPYGPENPFSYVHTSKGMIDLINDIREYWKKNPEAAVLVATNQYWPMPYYFRDRRSKLSYRKTDKPQQNAKKFKIMVMDKTVRWTKDGWTMKYYRLADNQESHTYFYVGTEAQKESGETKEEIIP